MNGAGSVDLVQIKQVAYDFLEIFMLSVKLSIELKIEKMKTPS